MCCLAVCGHVVVAGHLSMCVACPQMNVVLWLYCSVVYMWLGSMWLYWSLIYVLFSRMWPNGCAPTLPLSCGCTGLVPISHPTLVLWSWSDLDIRLFAGTTFPVWAELLF